MKHLLIVLCSLLVFFNISTFVYAEENSSDVENDIFYFVESGKRFNVDGDFFSYDVRFESSSKSIFGILYNNGKALYTYYFDSNYKYYRASFACVDYVVHENTGVTNADTFYFVGKTNDTFGWDDNDSMHDVVRSTNIPIFSSFDDAKIFYQTGDQSGIINKPSDGSIETDDTFALTDFTADNTVKASWSGTTHDGKSESYAEMFVDISVGYAYINAPGQIATTTPNIAEYPIENKTFTKLRSELKPSDSTIFLRYLEITPYYKLSSGWLVPPYKGRSCFVWFKKDGSIEKITNDFDSAGDDDIVVDSSFYLKNVSCVNSGAAYIFRRTQKQIYWSGTSKDSLLRSVPPEDTLVVVCFVGYDKDLNRKIFSYEELCKYEYGSSPGDIRLKQGWYTTSNSFDFFTETAFEMLEGQGYTFDGEVLLYPFYKMDDVLYEGRCSVVNVVNGEIKEIITDDDGNPDEVIIKPPKDGGDGDDDSDDNNDFSLGDIGDAPGYMFNLLKAFLSLVGSVPNLLGAIFPFLPVEINYLLSGAFVIILILRIIGR